MKVSQTHKKETRRRILAAAGRGFRRKGYGGLGVDGLAAGASVTSGAFYGHFSSKEEVFKEAVVDGLIKYQEAVKAFEEKYGEDWIAAFLDYYLGKQHRCNLEESCAVPGLSAEVMRSDDATKQAYEAELVEIAGNVAAGLGQRSKKNAWAFMALLAGAVLMARSVSSSKIAEEISKAARLWAEKMTKTDKSS